MSRKALLLLLALVLAASAASAALGSLVASFRNIGTGTHYGLAADANYLYSFYYYSGYGYPVIRMRRTNGAFVSSYRCPLGTGSGQYYVRGMSYDGLGALYLNNYYRRFVGRARASDGRLLSTWTWPSGYRYGICVDHKGIGGGTYIYQDYVNGNFWKSRTTGSLVSSWSMPNYTNDADLAWDYGNELIWYVNYNTDFIVAIDPDVPRQIKTSFRHPRWASIGSCYGIAYWGQYLYVSNSSGSPDEYIWVFHCPDTVGAAPASVGRIKALFE
jgi:hypothetical protein